MTASANNREDIAKKRVTILGSTGSVGTQALEVAKSLGFSITALSSDVKGRGRDPSGPKLPSG